MDKEIEELEKKRLEGTKPLPKKRGRKTTKK